MESLSQNRRILIIDQDETLVDALQDDIEYERLAEEFTVKQIEHSFDIKVFQKRDFLEFDVSSLEDWHQGLEEIYNSIESKNPYALLFLAFDEHFEPNHIQIIRRFWKVGYNLQIVICSTSQYPWNKLKASCEHIDQINFLELPTSTDEVQHLAHNLIEKWNLLSGVQLEQAKINNLVDEQVDYLYRAIHRLQNENTSLTQKLLEQKQSEQRILESEQKWKMLCEQSPDYITKIDRDGVILSANRPIFGEDTQEGIIGKNLFECIPQKYREPFFLVVQDSLKFEEPTKYEITTVTKKGKEFWWSNRIIPLKKQQRIDSFLIISTNITVQKKVSKVLSEQKTFYYDTFQNAPTGFAITAKDGRFLEVNKALCLRLGYTEQELCKKVIQELIHPDDLENHLTDIQTFLQKKIDTFQLEERYLCKDNSIIWVLLSISVHKDAQGYIKHFITQIIDITEKKTIEHYLEKAKEKAETANLAKTDFLATISHELRNSMHGILGFAQLGIRDIEGKKKDREEKVLHYFSRVKNAGERLLRLLNNLLDLSKLESGKMEYKIESVDLFELIEKSTDLFCPLIEEKEIHFIIEKPQFPTILKIDKEKIKQVIINLIANALKYTQKKKQIRIYLKLYKHSDSSEIQVNIEDQGIGIPNDELETIFDKFVQSRKTIHSPNSTGLGLAISKEIIQGHYGKIAVKSNIREGSTFSFTLPYFCL
ncbi:MAG: PAS domain S-box-containing protein [bacterium]|jgi:PAS domain S-box-containing protein